MAILGLYIFTRDLRLGDNRLFYRAINECDKLACLFVFDPKQKAVTAKGNGAANQYKSPHSIKFMCECVKSLKKELCGKLTIKFGNTAAVVKEMVGNKAVKVYISEDFTPYAKERQSQLSRAVGDRLIMGNNMEMTTISKGYKVMAAYKSAIYDLIPPPSKAPRDFERKLIKAQTSAADLAAYRELSKLPVESTLELIGGRDHGLVRLRGIHESLKDYHLTRNLPSQRTSLMSAYIRFGCISTREMYSWASKHLPPEAAASFKYELIYRDFFIQLYRNFSQEIYKQAKWNGKMAALDSKQQHKFAQWKSSKTGVAIVDAGMRELNSCGWMHGRARMITASYLIHDLEIPWYYGAQYFAQHLRDYDRIQNEMNWLWVAGIPIFRRRPNTLRFNPELQTKKYDPVHKYINQ